MKRGEDEVVDRLHAAKRAAIRAEGWVAAARQRETTEQDRLIAYSRAEMEIRDALRLLTAARMEVGDRRAAIRPLPAKTGTG